MPYHRCKEAPARLQMRKDCDVLLRTEISSFICEASFSSSAFLPLGLSLLFFLLYWTKHLHQRDLSIDQQRRLQMFSQTISCQVWQFPSSKVKIQVRGLVWFAIFFGFWYCSTFIVIRQLMSNYKLIRLERFVSSSTVKLCNELFFNCI